MRASAVWVNSAVKEHLLGKLATLKSRAEQRRVRPRLVIFDYLDHPQGFPLRHAATQFSALVQIEPIPRSLPADRFRDRLELLEKSRGIHGIAFPSFMPDAHRQALKGYHRLKRLDLDRPECSLTPQSLSFFQLAQAHDWSFAGRRTQIWYSEEFQDIAGFLASELRHCGLAVESRCLVARERMNGSSRIPQPLPAPLVGNCDLLWLLTLHRVRLPLAHLPEDCVVVDGAPLFSAPSCLEAEQLALLPFRTAGLCAGRGSLCSLVNLNRLLRLFSQSLSQSTEEQISVAGRNRFRSLGERAVR